MKKAVVTLEDNDYDAEQLKRCEQQIVDFIMNHSSKGNEIDKLRDQFNGVFRIIEAEQKKSKLLRLKSLMLLN